MNRESWFWISMVLLVILLLGSLSILVGSDDDGKIDTIVTPTVPLQELPMDDMTLTPDEVETPAADVGS